MAKVVTLNYEVIGPHVQAIIQLTQDNIEKFKASTAKIQSLSEQGVPDRIVSTITDKVHEASSYLPPLMEAAEDLSRTLSDKAEELSALESEGIGALSDL